MDSKLLKVSIHNAHVRDVIKLLRVEGLSFDISDWIQMKRTSRYSRIESRFDIIHSHYDTNDHCGTYACILGHMHIAGMVEMTTAGSDENFQLLGEYLINDYSWDVDACTHLGVYVGSYTRYTDAEDNRINATVDVVIDRLKMFLDYEYVVINDTTGNVVFEDKIDRKLGFTFNKG